MATIPLAGPGDLPVALGDIGKQQISKVADWGQLPAGSVVTKTEVLFPRLEEAK